MIYIATNVNFRSISGSSDLGLETPQIFRYITLHTFPNVPSRAHEHSPASCGPRYISKTPKNVEFSESSFTSKSFSPLISIYRRLVFDCPQRFGWLPDLRIDLDIPPMSALFRILRIDVAPCFFFFKLTS